MPKKIKDRIGLRGFVFEFFFNFFNLKFINFVVFQIF
jgi:hypothetical protein